MIQSFLTPVKEQVSTHSVLQSSLILGTKIRIHRLQKGFPDLENVHIAIFDVQEDRNFENN